MIHKLATGPCTLEIASAVESVGNFGPQVCFTGADGTSVYVNDSPAKRGLERLGLDMETAIGATIRFSQKKKDGKTFTDLDLAGEGTAATPAPAAAAARKRPARPRRCRRTRRWLRRGSGGGECRAPSAERRCSEKACAPAGCEHTGSRRFSGAAWLTRRQGSEMS